MTTALDRLAPGVRIRLLPSPRARTGEALDLSGRILSFTFEDTVAKADKVTLELANHDLALFDRPELAAGTLWEVSWGYPGAMAPPRRMVVKKLKGFQTLSLEAVSLGVLLHHEARTRSFQERTAGQVAAIIGGEHGYEGAFLDVDVAGEPLPLVTQAGETDARLLRRLAARQGWAFRIDGDGFHFHPPRARANRPRALVWHNDPGRGDVLSVSVESDLARRVEKVTVRGRDPMSKKTLDVTAAAGSLPAAAVGVDVDPPSGPFEVISAETGESTIDASRASADEPPGSKESRITSTVTTAAAISELKAKRQANARLAAAAVEAFKLNLEVVGDATLRADEQLELQGVGKRLSRRYTIRRATHRVSAQGYVCGLDLRSAAAATTARSAAARPTGASAAPTETVSAAASRAAGALEPIDLQDPETGQQITIFRPTGDPLGSGDPEGPTR